ncbi:TrkH family potassium uptake protein [Aurantiacibacter aquimixticola]|uniref:Ktr system potassium transporter B n=1 Tax=Aurantiacibacter aquimixticola TaxID=1958945 RepID=A0A419RVQ6_9SPHN|nr:potassium transporter TrkG [Aurantiacibacter aquimixticola]RJY09847.1 Ktr system potassium transporter B [Aurantiacibacter aquimixticola]
MADEGIGAPEEGDSGAAESGFEAISPPAALCMLYLSAIALGTMLLSLPWAQVEPLSFGEALFTSVSATTVTGLTVVPTGESFTLFGEVVIALLMQVGGLGLIVFAYPIIVWLDEAKGDAGEELLQTELGRPSVKGIGKVAAKVVIFALTVQAAGAAVLALTWVPDEGWYGVWRSVFHTVAAFNNAGFDLQGNSFQDYNGLPQVTLTIAALFIIGGLGWSVLLELSRRGKRNGLSVHSRLMLVATLVLLALGTAIFAGAEWSNPRTMGALANDGERWVAAFFQSATTRTAGFATLDFGAMRQETGFAATVFMFIGAGVGSTGGGVKVTTMAIVVLATIAFFRHRREPVVFGKVVEREKIFAALAALCSAGMLVVLGVFALLMTQQGEFEALMFEAVSAFGTVGLSQGATEGLDGIGRGIVMVLMFAGRVSPLFLAYFLLAPKKTPERDGKAHIHIG